MPCSRVGADVAHDTTFVSVNNDAATENSHLLAYLGLCCILQLLRQIFVCNICLHWLLTLAIHFMCLVSGLFFTTTISATPCAGLPLNNCSEPAIEIV